MAIETFPFDPAHYLDDEASIAAYMSEALSTGDVAFIADALAVAKRARGLTTTPIDPSPALSSVLDTLRALGLRLTVTAT